MKSFLVVNQLNDPFYIDYDVQFAEYIFKRAKQSGFIEEDADTTELDANLVMQLFSPLVLSQWLLIDQTKEPCSSIICPDGFLFAFRHTDDLLFIAVSGDRTESEAFLHRKIQVFMMIMRFIFGPVNEEMSQTHVHSRKSKWDFLRLLMQNWLELIHSEQAFLVEAIERLHVNQMVNEKCMEILLKSIRQFQTSKDLPTHHAMLLVNSKLLALYSNRSAHELRPKDLLMTIILSKTIYPHADRLEDLFSKFYSNTKTQADNLSTVDDNSEPGDDEYHSAPNTPRGHRSQSPTSSEKLAAAKGGTVSDQDSQSEKSMEKITLLELFTGKSPDDVLAKEHGQAEDMPAAGDGRGEEQEHTSKGANKYCNTISVEVIVHQAADSELLGAVALAEQPALGAVALAEQPALGAVALAEQPALGAVALAEQPALENSPPAVDQQLSNGHDLTLSSSQNLASLTKTVVPDYQYSEIMKPEITGAESVESNDPLTAVISESKEEDSTEKEKSKSPTGDSNDQPSSEVGQKEPCNSEDSSLTVKSSSDPDVSPHSMKPDTQSQHGSGIVFVPATNCNIQSALSDQQHNTSLKSLEEKLVSEGVLTRNKSHSSMHTSGSSSQTDLSSKSRNSTPSQESGEPEMPSRTSSMISNLSKSYPELLPQTGIALPTIESLSDPSQDFTNEIKKSRQITTAMGNPKPGTVPFDAVPATARSGTESSSTTQETASSRSAFSSSSSGTLYLPQTIFLETSTCLYSPYNLHTTQVLPGVTLVMLSQAPRHTLADSLYQVIQTIKDLVYGRRSKLPRNRSIYVYETISAQLGKIHNGLKKYKGRVQNLGSDVHARWEKEDLKFKLLDFLERETSFRIPPELESPLMELYKKLRELFSLLYLTPIGYSSQIWETLAQIRDRVKTELQDYREYLNVKAQRNITMTSYINDFPGLIHFIFIDRHFHQMTAPSLNISLKEGESMDATSFLKEKIWTMHQHMMSKLSEGYTTVMMRDGDFYYSYFLWFEDSMGNPIPVQESYKPARKQAYPGILCGPFYRDLLQTCFPHAIQGSIHCFELFLMHLGTVHPMYIAAQCKKLAYKMWEMSGEIHFSVNLL